MKKIISIFRKIFSFVPNGKTTRIVELSSGYVPQIWFYDDELGIFRWAVFGHDGQPAFDPEDHFRWFKRKSYEEANKLLQEMMGRALAYLKEKEDKRSLKIG